MRKVVRRVEDFLLGDVHVLGSPCDDKGRLLPANRRLDVGVRFGTQSFYLAAYRGAVKGEKETIKRW